MVLFIFGCYLILFSPILIPVIALIFSIIFKDSYAKENYYAQKAKDCHAKAEQLRKEYVEKYGELPR